MEYVYATLLVDEAGGELNETNLTAVLEAAGCTVSESRVRALVAALEGLDLGSLDPADLAGGTGPAGTEHGDGAPTDGADDGIAPDEPTGWDGPEE